MFEDLLRPQHLLLILAVALLVFGPSKLPELGKGLAQGIKNFKDAIKTAPEETAADKKQSTEKPS
jgi:sec-independent protein translocase protein TatA